MKIVVCVKQVPDTAEVKIDSKTNNLVREGVPSILNPFDENAMEEALSLRDRHGGSVTVVSMGPLQAAAALSYCLQMGADEAVLLSDGAVRGSDTLATGYALSKLIGYVGYDLVLCGNEAIDGCTGQVGPSIAGHLDIPQLTYVREVKVEDGLVRVLRDAGSMVEYLETELPAVVCVLKGINQPRKRTQTDKQPKVVSAAEVGLDVSRIGNDGSPTKVVTIRMSDARAKSYIDIDDSLSWEDRIKMIVNGGMEMSSKVDLWRGSCGDVTDRLMDLADFNKFFEQL